MTPTVTTKVEVNMESQDHIAELRTLDPGHGRPEYWNDFRANVMARAAFELARRRRAVRASVTAVLSGWSRSLIPVALAAAAIAAVMLATEARHDTEAAARLAVHDILGEVEDEPAFEAFVGSDQTANAGAFLALVEGGTR